MSHKIPLIDHPAEDQVVFDPRLLRSGAKECHAFPLVLSQAELSAVPEVRALSNGAARVYCDLTPSEGFILCHMTVKAMVSLIDNHDFKVKKTAVSDDADLALSEDPETADVLPDPNGKYDLRPTALALFYSAIPEGFATKAMKGYKAEGFEIISEDEYLAREAKAAKSIPNAFAKALKVDPDDKD